jgi:hypothetical protein
VDSAFATSDADSDGTLGTNDVLVSFPKAADPNQDQVHAFTELMDLEGDGDAQSLAERNEVLENAICWLLNCNVCGEIYLQFSPAVNPPTPQTGVPATLSIALGNNGECDGAAFSASVQMAPGLILISATSDYGQPTISNGVVSLYFNRIPARQLFTLTITVLPVIAGWVTNAVHTQAASTTSIDDQFVFQVEGVAIQAAGSASVLVSAFAQPGLSYVLERARLPAQGAEFLWSPLTNFIFIAPQFQMRDAVPGAGRGSIYRLQSAP